MNVTWTRAALRQLGSLEAYIASHDPAAASRVVNRIERAAARLGRMPHLGRAVRARDARAMVVAGTRYTMIYAVRADTIVVLALFHGRQQRPTSFLPG